MRKYYSLLIRYDGIWTVQFGDYDRKVVREEMLLGYEDVRRKDMQIICTSDQQSDIDAATAKLNEGK